MYCNLERDILTVYPYKDENIQELLCRLYSKIEELKQNGQVIDIKEIMQLIKDNDKRIDSSIHSILEFHDFVGPHNDWTPAINEALKHSMLLYFPAGTYCISDTIVLDPHHAIYGDGINTVFKWCGPADDRKAVIRMGQNDISAVPSIRNDNIRVKNILIDGMDRAGFGIYGTYLDYQSEIDAVQVTRTTAYAVYVARSWYCKYTNISAVKNRGCGLAFGMPLIHTDGTFIDWDKQFQWQDSLNMNGNLIQNVRSNFSGLDGKFNLETNTKWGYGLGFGHGFNFAVDGYLSEHSDGVGVYIYRNGDKVMNLDNGYIEANTHEAVKTGRSTYAVPVYFDIFHVESRWTKMQNTFIHYGDFPGVPRAKLKMLYNGHNRHDQGGADNHHHFPNSIILENIADGCNIINHKCTDSLDIFHLKNCHWETASTFPGAVNFNNGLPVPIASATIQGNNSGGDSTQKLEVPPSYVNMSQRKLFVYSKTAMQRPTPQIGHSNPQIHVTYRDQYHQGGPRNSDYWINLNEKLPAQLKEYTYYEICDIPQWNSTAYLYNIASTPTLEFVVFEYTGDELTYEDKDKFNKI